MSNSERIRLFQVLLSNVKPKFDRRPYVSDKPKAIKKGINQFLSISESERNKMGGKGKAYVKAFTYEELSKKYIQLFDRL